MQFPSIDTPAFYPGLLFTIFIVLTSVMFFREVRREGRGNMVSALAISGFATMILATLLSLLGLIQTQVLVITFVITSIFAVFFLLSSRNP